MHRRCATVVGDIGRRARRGVVCDRVSEQPHALEAAAVVDADCESGAGTPLSSQGAADDVAARIVVAAPLVQEHASAPCASGS
jgi:hypothetical protein